LLAALLGALVVTALIVGLMLPMRARWGKAGRRVSLMESRIADAVAMYKQAPSLMREVSRLEQVANGIASPDKTVGPGMVRRIETLTKAGGMTLLNIIPSEPQELEGSFKHTALFEVEARFDRVARLLWDLEQPPNELWVESVTINSDQTTNENVRATIGVSVYTLIPPGGKDDEQT
jgi:hypothetical protein